MVADVVDFDEHYALDDNGVDVRLYMHPAGAARGMATSIVLLIDLGVEVLAKDHHGNTSLHLAAVNGLIRAIRQPVDAGRLGSLKDRAYELGDRHDISTRSSAIQVSNIASRHLVQDR
jgi:ankyrin repeat protein